MPKGWLRIGAQTNNRRIREQGYASGSLVVVVNIAFVDIAAYFTPGARIDATHSAIDILVSLCTYLVHRSSLCCCSHAPSSPVMVSRGGVCVRVRRCRYQGVFESLYSGLD